ncbi:hypothetical protein ACJIZ3_017296 [Penstemon smallii]|uniref:J domain-containing protein n=1 Tax=Penstemon smallii TaxID=265156 RepID=A0ABD3SV55_9LAMI
MECNKEEAIRSKAIAENKFLLLDVAGAKKFALKAQTLFPKLHGISQFIEVINIYVDNEKKINGEVDYYRVFGVDPFAEEEILKKQYKKLALCLHPDKNKSVGADGAFKIMSQAWSVLSDKDKRRAYNLKLNLNVKKAPNQGELSAAKPFKTPAAKSSSSTTTSSQSVNSKYNPAPCHARNTTSSETPTSQQYNSRKANPPATNTSSHTRPAKVAAADSKYNPTATPAMKADSQHVRNPDRIHDPVRNPSSARNTTSSRTPTNQQYNSMKVNPPATNTSSHTRQKTSAYIPAPCQPKNPTATQANPKSGNGSQQHVPNPVCNPKSETFWTSCNRCRIPYIYQKIYLNRNLRCLRCQQYFIAAEMTTDPNVNTRSSGSKSVPATRATRTCSRPSNETRGGGGGESKQKSGNVPEKAEPVSSAPKKRPIGTQKSGEEIRGNAGSKKTCANAR